MNEVKTISELLGILDSVNYTFCRGQADVSWLLSPSITRIPNHDKCYSMRLTGWLDAESYLIREFKKYAYPYLKNDPTNDYDWLVHAQHHGLPTRILDWSENPLKALFFAVEDRGFDHVDGALHVCQPQQIGPTTGDIHYGTGVQFFRSRYTNDRILAQEGAFSITYIKQENDDFETNLDVNTTELMEYKKIKIPKESKKLLRDKLNRLGINYRTIFPGLDGISKMLKSGFA